LGRCWCALRNALRGADGLASFWCCQVTSRCARRTPPATRGATCAASARMQRSPRHARFASLSASCHVLAVAGINGGLLSPINCSNVSSSSRIVYCLSPVDTVVFVVVESLRGVCVCVHRDREQCVRVESPRPILVPVLQISTFLTPLLHRCACAPCRHTPILGVRNSLRALLALRARNATSPTAWTAHKSCKFHGLNPEHDKNASSTCTIAKSSTETRGRRATISPSAHSARRLCADQSQAASQPIVSAAACSSTTWARACVVEVAAAMLVQRRRLQVCRLAWLAPPLPLYSLSQRQRASRHWTRCHPAWHRPHLSWQLVRKCATQAASAQATQWRWRRNSSSTGASAAAAAAAACARASSSALPRLRTRAASSDRATPCCPTAIAAASARHSTAADRRRRASAG